MSRAGRAALPRGFWTIWSAVAVDLVGFGMVLPILPLYARRFHASPLASTLLVSAYSAAGFVAAPLWGRLSDRVGRRPVLIVALAGTAVGSLLTGLAGGLALLFVGRIVDGASGGSVGVAQAAAADLAGRGDRTRMFGLIGAAFGLGFVAGPGIGALAALAGPRTPFLLAAGLAALNTVVAAIRLPETRPASAASGGAAGPSERPAGAGRRSGGPGGGAVIPLLLVAFAATTAFAAFEATFSLFGRRHLGFGIGSAAAVFAAIGLVIVVVQGGLVHYAVTALGERATLVAGLVADVGGLAWLAEARSWASAAPALALLTVGQGLVQTTMASTLAGLAGPDRRGRLLGAQQSAASLARVVGPAAGGALLGQGASGRPYLMGAGLTAAAVVGICVAFASRAGPAEE